MRNHQRSLFSPTLSSQKPQPFSKRSLTPEGFAPASWSSYFKLKKGLIIMPFFASQRFMLHPSQMSPDEI